MDKGHDRDRIFEYLEENESRLARIEGALLGDKNYDSKGLVHKVSINEKRIEDNTTKLNRIWIAGTVIAILFTIVIQVTKIIS